MFGRLVSIGFAAVGVALLLWAAYLWLPRAVAGPTFEVEEAALVFNDLPPDREEVVEFIVRNKTNQPLRVLGTPGYG
jgi:hypothetical protein